MKPCIIALLTAIVFITPAMKAQQTLTLTAITVPDGIGNSYELSSSIYKTSGVLTESLDIPEEIASVEKQYTMNWVDDLLPDKFQPRSALSVALVKNIQNQDDGAFLAYTLRGFSVQIIDDRRLEMCLQKSGIAAESVLSLFKQAIDFSAEMPNRSEAVLSLSETHTIDASHSYGKIVVSRPAGRSCWFSQPIEWCRDSDKILFIVQKVKGDCGRDKNGNIVPERMFGGIEASVATPFRRFENANRIDYAKAAAATWLLSNPAPIVAVPPNGVVGPPLRIPGSNDYLMPPVYHTNSP